MRTRILTTIVGLPLIVVLILLGGSVLQFTILAISLIGLYEFYRAISGNYKPIRCIGYGATIVYFLALNFIQAHNLVFLSLLLFCY